MSYERVVNCVRRVCRGVASSEGLRQALPDRRLVNPVGNLYHEYEALHPRQWSYLFGALIASGLA